MTSRWSNMHAEATGRGVKRWLSKQPVCRDCKQKRMRPYYTLVHRGNQMVSVKVRNVVCADCEKKLQKAGLPVPEPRSAA